MLMLPMRDGRTNKRTTSEYRATQLLICEKLSLAMMTKMTKTRASCDICMTKPKFGESVFCFRRHL